MSVDMYGSLDRVEKRYVTVSDDDGHNYCIPVERLSEFNDWLDDERSMYEENDLFDEYRIEGTMTFTDPRRMDGTPLH